MYLAAGTEAKKHMQPESVFQPTAHKIANSVLRTEEFSEFYYDYYFVLSIGWGILQLAAILGISLQCERIVVLHEGN